MAFLTKAPASWNVEDTCSFLESLELTAVVPAVQANAVDGADLLQLLNEDSHLLGSELHLTQLQQRKLRKGLDQHTLALEWGAAAPRAEEDSEFVVVSGCDADMGQASGGDFLAPKPAHYSAIAADVSPNVEVVARELAEPTTAPANDSAYSYNSTYPYVPPQAGGAGTRQAPATGTSVPNASVGNAPPTPPTTSRYVEPQRMAFGERAYHNPADTPSPPPNGASPLPPPPDTLESATRRLVASSVALGEDWRRTGLGIAHGFTGAAPRAPPPKRNVVEGTVGVVGDSIGVAGAAVGQTLRGLSMMFRG